MPGIAVSQAGELDIHVIYFGEVGGVGVEVVGMATDAPPPNDKGIGY